MMLKKRAHVNNPRNQTRVPDEVRTRVRNLVRMKKYQTTYSGIGQYYQLFSERNRMNFWGYHGPVPAELMKRLKKIPHVTKVIYQRRNEQPHAGWSSTTRLLVYFDY